MDETDSVGEPRKTPRGRLIYRRRIDGKLIVGGEGATWADAEDSGEKLRRFNVDGVDPGEQGPGSSPDGAVASRGNRAG